MNYRGIEWINDSDLSRKLGKSRQYVNCMLRKGKTHEEIIDCVISKKLEYKGHKIKYLI